MITESSWGGSAGSVQDSSEGKGQGGRRVTVASDFVVVDEDRDVSVEVYCDGASVDTSKAPDEAFQSILSGGGAGAGAGAGSGGAMAIAFAGAEANIAPIAVDLVNALSTVIRSCVTSHRARLLERSELRRTNAELTSRVTEKAEALQQSETEALRSNDPTRVVSRRSELV